MIAAIVEFFFALRAHDLDDAALDDMRGVAFDQPVDHAGASDQPDLANGQRQQWMLDTTIQFAAHHHLGEAVRSSKLLLQLPLVEPLSLEGVDRNRLRRKRVAALRELRQWRYLGRAARKLLQPERIRKLRIPLFSDAQHRCLLELLELAVGEAPDGELVKIVYEDAADIRGQPVVGDNIDQQPSVHQRGNAFDQKPFLVPGASTVFVDDRQIRRVQEKQVKRFVTDAAVKEAAEADAVKPCLRFLCAALVQLHAVGVAVIPLRQLTQGLAAAAAAAGIKKICRDAFGEMNAPQEQRDVVGIGGIIARLDVIHEPADDRGVGFLPRGKRRGEFGERFIHRLIARAHKLEACKPVPELVCCRGERVFLHFQQEKLGGGKPFDQVRADTLQLRVGVPCCRKVALPVFFDPCPLHDHTLRRLHDLRLELGELVKGIGLLRLQFKRLTHCLHDPFSAHSAYPADAGTTTS